MKEHYLLDFKDSTRPWFTADIVQRDTEFRGIIWKIQFSARG